MRSGIYKITCVPSGKAYIGSSVNVEKRWREHRHHLAKGKHHSPTLQRAWNKYGSAAFTWEVLERVGEHELLSREQHYLDYYQPFKSAGFNHAPKAGSPRGVKHSVEVREANRQRTLMRFTDPEERQRHSASQKRRYERSEEREAHYQARCAEWWVRSPDGLVVGIVLDLKKFCLEHGLSRRGMSQMGRNETDQTSYNGWFCVKVTHRGQKKVREHERSRTHQAG